jgi:pSer/pThr/pTyr-binding forkhead associated (FHA) protein
MDVRLVVARGKTDAKQINLGSSTLIGRSPECNLRIASGQVSRKHCLIKIAEDHVCVRDLGSANGTRLNGQTITAETDVPVAPGSTLAVGPLKFIVEFTAPRCDDDTELLASPSGGSSDLREVQQMAPAPVAEGEETKDYPASRARQRGAGPPVVVSDRPDPETGREGDAGGGRDRPRPARTTEAEFEGIPKETVFDGEFAGASKPPEIGNETDFIFEEDDLRQLTAAIDGPGTAAPVADAPAGAGDAPPEAPPAEKLPRERGWRLLDMLRRKLKPAPPAPAARAPGDDDETLSNFLKDQ